MCVRSYHLYNVGLNMCLSCTTNDIFSIKYWHDLKMWVRGRSRPLKMALIDRSYTTSYWSEIVSIALSCAIFDAE